MSVTYFRSDGWVKSSTGPAIPGAQVFVCTQPADTADYPPTPLASIYSDPAGLIPLSQPILTDGFGHYDFYAPSGTYTLVVAFGGSIQQVYPDQSVGAVIASGLLVLNNPIVNPNFNDTIPSAPPGYVNVSWQFSGGYVSACVPISASGATIEINGSVITGGVPNFNNTTPAAPAGNTNVLWQHDSSGNISAYVQTSSISTSVNNQSGSYVAALSDNNNLIVISSASSNTLTVPPNSSVSFPVGSTLTIIQGGAGQTSFLAGAGVTINTPSSLLARAQYSTISVIQVATNVWNAAGDLQ